MRVLSGAAPHLSPTRNNPLRIAGFQGYNNRWQRRGSPVFFCPIGIISLSATFLYPFSEKILSFSHILRLYFSSSSFASSKMPGAPLHGWPLCDMQSLRSCISCLLSSSTGNFPYSSTLFEKRFYNNNFLAKTSRDIADYLALSFQGF